ncbi:MAG: hypothetical protein D6784_18265 [Chloroflexi bacterium]|nr:MAG: hypothetical protein D6784_18265 [Chloroflexota bacterium]
MATVTINDTYAEVLSALGDLQEAIDTALQRYTIEQIGTKIAELQRRDAHYQQKYGMDYHTFSERIAEDESFVNQIEASVSKTWEFDLSDWEFCHKGIEDWIRKLQAILLT